MAFTIPNGVTDVIKKLSNFPNRIDRLKATQLKAMFDQAAKNVQEDVKRLVSELGASTAAGNIGFARSTEVPADTVQDAIENVQSQIAGVAMGDVPNGSVTAEKLDARVLRAGNVSCSALQGMHETNPFTGGRPNVQEYFEELAQSPCLTIEFYHDNTFEVYTKNAGLAVRYVSPGKFFILIPSVDCVIPSNVTSVGLKFSQTIGDEVVGTLKVPPGGTFRYGRAYLIVDVGNLEFMVVNQSEIE